jgi:hypothetical protein
MNMTVGGLQQLKVGRGGWCYYNDDDVEHERLALGLRFGLEGTRIVIKAVHLETQERVTGTSLRALPLGRIEALANAPHIADAIRRSIANDAKAVGEEHAAYWEALVPTSAPTMMATTVTFFNSAQGEMTTVPMRLLVPVSSGEPPKTSAKKPDDFYERVAARYSELAGQVRDPAIRLAQENQVPHTTAHRWIKEARRRGLLGQGRKVGWGPKP